MESTICSNGNGKAMCDVVNWEELGFEAVPTDYMYVAKCSKDGSFSEGSLTNHGTIELSPASGILNYGQGLFEGLKAYRGADNHIRLFRPEENARRMQMGAQRLCMVEPTTELFVNAVKQTALANKRWISPLGKGALYLRPLLMGTGPILGAKPAPEYTFLVFATPVGHYHKNRESLDLVVESKLHRAAPGGTGGVKSVTNYSPVFEALKRAKTGGFDDVLFLDAIVGKYIEEVSTCNIFILKGNVVSTPITQGTILPGVTRKSIMEIAQDLGYKVEEKLVPLEDVLAADEVFCTGTAMIVTPVRSITYQGKRVEYRTGEEAVSKKLRETLTGIQLGLIEDKKGWTVKIE